MTELGRVCYLDNEPMAARVTLKGEFGIDATCAISNNKTDHILTLETPSRVFKLKIDKVEQRKAWFEAILSIIKNDYKIRVLERVNTYDVTFLHVKSPDGIAYRASPNLEDRIRDERGPECGEVIRVAESYSGWVKLENGYWLPTQVGDRHLLSDSLPIIYSRSAGSADLATRHPSDASVWTRWSKWWSKDMDAGSVRSSLAFELDISRRNTTIREEVERLNSSASDPLPSVHKQSSRSLSDEKDPDGKSLSQQVMEKFSIDATPSLPPEHILEEKDPEKDEPSSQNTPRSQKNEPDHRRTNTGLISL